MVEKETPLCHHSLCLFKPKPNHLQLDLTAHHTRTTIRSCPSLFFLHHHPLSSSSSSPFTTVPNILGQDRKEMTEEESSMVVQASVLLRIIETLILIFQLFIKMDKKKSNGVRNLFGGNSNEIAVVPVLEDCFNSVLDFYEQLGKYGEIESLNICDNLADHMVGNVYAQIREEEHVAAALQDLSGRFYASIDINFDFNFITMISFKKLIIRLYLQVAPLSLISQQLRISMKQHVVSMKKTYVTVVVTATSCI
ncbi:hypothetical protein L2E82_15705 [Cichorium intybus]|uniref:Uncharacterized protein n=1 Tax=Cichorium intybus TaxID=13427 RepID=A0ACB9F3J9_CICIN|nr:hypothetical protein L2E82_15705 [Cichorium intybus]